MTQERELDLTNVETARGLHDVLAQSPGFPKYYGQNWDAFWDYISDPEQSKIPARLLVKGWAALSARLPHDAALLRRCLEDLRTARPERLVYWLE